MSMNISNACKTDLIHMFVASRNRMCIYVSRPPGGPHLREAYTSRRCPITLPALSLPSYSLHKLYFFYCSHVYVQAISICIEHSRYFSADLLLLLILENCDSQFTIVTEPRTISCLFLNICPFWKYKKGR